MRAMTKSAVRLARTARLVLKQFLRTDYRGVVALAAEWSERR
jgi:hypothetical protein